MKSPNEAREASSYENKYDRIRSQPHLAVFTNRRRHVGHGQDGIFVAGILAGSCHNAVRCNRAGFVGARVSIARTNTEESDRNWRLYFVVFTAREELYSNR